MKTFLTAGLMVLMSVVGWAADSTIHGLPSLPGEPDGAEYIPVDKQTSPGVWHNYKLLSGVVGAKTGNVVNYYTYPSNYYAGNTYVSQYFTTNVLVDAGVSNYFTTNVILNTYQYVTNTTITNFIDQSSYVSNYFATNIWTTNLYQADTYVSNYFQTNFFTANNTTNIYNITTNLITTNLITQTFQVTSNAYFYETNFVYYDIVTNLTVVNNSYISNLFVTNITAKVMNVQNIYAITSSVDNITITNGATNLSLNASQYVATDANKRLVSTRNLANGTNLFLEGITSPTNAHFGATIDFSTREATTNISADVTFTGMSNWNATNYNKAIRYLVNFSGADRTITIPTGWGNDIARLTPTTYTASNNMVLGLFISCQLNQFTNCNSLR